MQVSGIGFGSGMGPVADLSRTWNVSSDSLIAENTLASRVTIKSWRQVVANSVC
jgi:hypothetical protein